MRKTWATRHRFNVHAELIAIPMYVLEENDYDIYATTTLILYQVLEQSSTQTKYFIIKKKINIHFSFFFFFFISMLRCYACFYY